MTSTRPSPSARKPLNPRERISPWTSSASSTSSRWNRTAGLASAGSLRSRNGTSRAADPYPTSILYPYYHGINQMFPTSHQLFKSTLLISFPVSTLCSHFVEISQQLIDQSTTKMSQGQFSLLNIFYPIETVLKLAFIVMAPFNLPYTLLLAFVASVIGLIRVVKRPQFSKQYLGKVLMNNHGQNILYSSFGAIGFVNYLYYAPIVLFFLYGIIEFLRLKLPNLAFNRYGDLIRHNKWWVYEGKCRMEIFFFLYLVFTLPFDLMGRGLKCFIMGQFLFIKYRINQEFTHSCSMMNTWVEQKTAKIGFVNTIYKKCAGWVYGYATRELSQNPAPQQPQQPQN